jgi:hypothetical protein
MGCTCFARALVEDARMLVVFVRTLVYCPQSLIDFANHRLKRSTVNGATSGQAPVNRRGVLHTPCSSRRRLSRKIGGFVIASGAKQSKGR